MQFHLPICNISYPYAFSIFILPLLVLVCPPLIREKSPSYRRLHCAAQVRVIFRLPHELGDYPHPLAYVEFFTCRRVASDTYGMYVVRRAKVRQQRKAGVIRLDSIRSACHLYPRFGLRCDRSWTTENVLDKCESFFVSPYLSSYFFQALSIPYNLGIPKDGPDSEAPDF